MTKKQIKQVVLAVAAGAGMEWNEDVGNYDCGGFWSEFNPVNFCAFMCGIKKMFELDDNSYILKHWNID